MALAARGYTSIMRVGRLLVWCVIILLVVVPAASLAWTAANGAHLAGMKAPRSEAASGWRTVTTAPGVEGLSPDPPGRRPAGTPALDRLVAIDPRTPFHPPRA